MAAFRASAHRRTPSWPRKVPAQAKASGGPATHHSTSSASKSKSPSVTVALHHGARPRRRSVRQEVRSRRPHYPLRRSPAAARRQRRSAQAILLPPGAWITTETAEAPAVASTVAKPLPAPAAFVVKLGQISLGGAAGPLGSNL